MKRGEPFLLAERSRTVGAATKVPAKLAVVIACYNYAEFVGGAIESVISQGGTIASSS